MFFDIALRFQGYPSGSRQDGEVGIIRQFYMGTPELFVRRVSNPVGIGVGYEAMQERADRSNRERNPEQSQGSERR